MVLHYVHLFGEHIDNAISVLDMGVPDPITPELHTDTPKVIRDTGPNQSKNNHKSVA